MGTTGLAVLVIVAGTVAVFKMLTSSRGKLTLPGINITWGK